LPGAVTPVSARAAASRLALTAASILFCAIGTPSPARAEPEQYTIDPSHTFPQFEIDHLGYSRHRGRFNRTAGRLMLDRAARTGSVEVTIDAASIDTGDEKLETILKTDAFFNVEKHPALSFRSTAMQFDGDRPVAVDGELTLLGVSRPLRLELDHFRCGLVLIGLRYVCGANATARFSRTAFGMDRYISFGLGDEVRVTIQIEAQREASSLPPPAPTVTP
jgi:polyisoprenoid-binding protein YceI